MRVKNSNDGDAKKDRYHWKQKRLVVEAFRVNYHSVYEVDEHMDRDKRANAR